MCGRYSLALGDAAGLRARFPIGESVAVPEARYNIAPGDDVLAVTTTRDGEARGEMLRWGLVPPWARDPRAGVKTINARAETVQERPAYREAFKRFRCLIPADGFYEWQRRPGTPKQPFHITRADRAPFAFAGLWSRWRSPDGELTLRSCTIITRAAGEALRAVHDRQPVILAPDHERLWLARDTAPEILLDLLAGLDDGQLGLTPVGTAVNDARYDGPDCLAPPPPEGGGSTSRGATAAVAEARPTLF